MRGTCASREDARRLIETVLERCGRLDALVNNAGGQYFTPAESIVAKGWRAVWRLNVEGMLNMAEAAVELGDGRRGRAQGGRRAGEARGCRGGRGPGGEGARTPEGEVAGAGKGGGGARS